MPYRPAVLFDLDGTLIDTAPDFTTVLNRLRDRHSLPPLPYAAIRQTVSHGARALVTLGFDLKEGDTDFELRRQELLALYADHLAVESRLFPGCEPALAWLEQRGIPWGIVTNKPRRYAEPLLAELGLTTRCATLVCPDDVERTKPHPEPLFRALSNVQCVPGDSLYIGDHRRDIEAGRNAGMLTAAAHYGYIEAHDPASKWGADANIERPEQLIALFERMLQTPTKS